MFFFCSIGFAMVPHFTNISIPFPPEPADLPGEKVPLPTALYTFFFCWLLDGTDTNSEAISLEEKATPSSVAIDSKIKSLGQDLLFAVCHG